MPTRRFSLKRGEPKRIEVSWQGSFEQVTLRLDDTPIGTVPSRKELKAGYRFPLNDGSFITVQLSESSWPRRLLLLRNGLPLPGSSADPRLVLKSVAGLILFIGGLTTSAGLKLTFFSTLLLPITLALGLFAGTLLFGIASILSKRLFRDELISRYFSFSFGVLFILFLVAAVLSIQLSSILPGPGVLIEGLVFLLLGVFVWRGSGIALAIAIVLYTLDGGVWFFFGMFSGSFFLTSLATRATFFAIFYRVAFLTAMGQGFNALITIDEEERYLAARRSASGQ